jgi:hypothetical protein
MESAKKKSVVRSTSMGNKKTAKKIHKLEELMRNCRIYSLSVLFENLISVENNKKIPITKSLKIQLIETRVKKMREFFSCTYY